MREYLYFFCKHFATATFYSPFLVVLHVKVVCFLPSLELATTNVSIWCPVSFDISELYGYELLELPKYLSTGTYCVFRIGLETLLSYFYYCVLYLKHIRSAKSKKSIRVWFLPIRLQHCSHHT